MDITYSVAAAGVTDCDATGDVSINLTNYGDKVYSQVSSYNEEVRYHTTCADIFEDSSIGELP